VAITERATPLPPGQRLGPYEIVRLLGSGAFADVYLARHTLLECDVALKVVRETAADRFEQYGAKVMSRLQHPNIVRVQFADRIDGQLVVAMDYVRGRTLRAELDGGGPLAPARAVEIAAQICAALEYLHGFQLGDAAGFAHLDLKPGNVLIGDDGVVKVTDFGLTRVTEGHEQGTERIAGSPAYMAPEQFEGRGTPRSDIWAVGVLLYEMLRGAPPFQAFSLEEYRSLILGNAGDRGLSYSGVPAALADVIRRCLRYQPGDRFESAGELAEALRAATDTAEGARCPKCHALLPAGGGDCPECTLADLAGKTLLRQPALELEPPSRPVQPRRRAHRGRLWPAVAATCLVVAGAIVALHPSSVPGAIAAVRSSFWFGGAAATPVEQAWRKILALETSRAGTYDERVAALTGFLGSFPDAAEAAMARGQLRLWTDEARLFQAAERLDKTPGMKICAALASWSDFIARQSTGFMEAYALGRRASWQAQLTSYDGYAVLRVIGATGLQPSGREASEDSRPDPFFVVREGDDVVHQSRAFKNQPSPVWDEQVRVHLRPGQGLFLEIRDRDVAGYHVLVVQPLTPLPPDGAFTVSSGGVRTQLAIERDR
jgi:serine/threonine-protein kinase